MRPRTLARLRRRRVTGSTDHVVVVGAGLAGLSAAMHLAGAGRQVTVLERGPSPGGRAAVLPVDTAAGTYRFDPGPTVLTMPDLIADCFAAVGESLDTWMDLSPVAPLYRASFADGSSLDVHSDPDRMAQEIEEFAGPDQVPGFHRYVDFVSRLYRYEMRDFIDRNLDSPLDLISLNLARLVAAGGFRRLGPTVARYLADPRLQRVYSFQSMYAGLAPAEALALYAVIAYMDSVAGVYFPRGGVHAVPQAMAAAAARHGVVLRYGTEVTAVEHSGGRAHAVRTSDGERVPCDVAILNPDLPVAYRDLLGLVPRRVARLRYSPSCYLLLTGSRTPCAGASHHNIHFGGAWEEVFADLRAGRLMSDPSFFVSVPTRSDASLAPAGREMSSVLFPTPALGTSTNWTTTGPLYLEHVLEVLAAHGYTGLVEGVEVRRTLTPLDWEARGMARGTPFACAHTFGQTGPFRPGNLWGENVVFAGSGTQPGVGVPMVILSGRLAAERVTGRDPAYRSGAWR